MVNVLTFLDPERILLGGGVSERPGFVEEANKRLAERIQNHPYLDHSYVPELRACERGNEAGVLGANLHRTNHPLGRFCFPPASFRSRSPCFSDGP